MGRLLVVWFLASCFVGLFTFVLWSVSVIVWLAKSGSDVVSVSYWSNPVFPALPSIWLARLDVWLGLYLLVVLPAAATIFTLGEAWTKKAGANFIEAPIGEGQPDRCVVVLTAYNDEASIGQAVREFASEPSVTRVLVVDNNSVDGTARVATEAGALVFREPRQGYGYACIRGISEALALPGAQTIVLAEGDMTFFGGDVRKLLPYVSDADLVLGTRTTRPLTFEGSQMDWFLVWGNLFLAFLLRLRFWDPVFLGVVSVTDVGCTFRAIRRDSLARIMGQLDLGGDSFSPHMIGVALRNRLKIVEVPIRFRQRIGVSKGAGGSRSRAIRIGLEMVGEILWS